MKNAETYFSDIKLQPGEELCRIPVVCPACGFTSEELEGAINNRQTADNQVQQLLQTVARMEHAAKRGIEINQNPVPSIPAEKTISVEQCEWILKDCVLFRDLICRTFGLPKQPVCR